MTRKTIQKMFAAVPLPLVFCVFLPACGYDTDTCNIDCQDTSKPETLVSQYFKETTCEICAEKFLQVREEVCGTEKNPKCLCVYYCHSMWEFKY